MSRCCTATIDMDELAALNLDRRRLEMAERIWQAACPGESLIGQVDSLLALEAQSVADLARIMAEELARAEEKTPTRH